MHESVRAREIEKKIRDRARAAGIANIEKVVLKMGAGEGESPADLEHIVKEHMGINNLEIIREKIVLVCRDCSRIIKDDSLTVNCPACGSIKIEISSGLGIEVVSVS